MLLSTFPFFISYLGYSETISSLCVAIFCLISVLLRPIVVYMLDSEKRRGILLIGIILMAIIPLGYLLVYTVISSTALATTIAPAIGEWIMKKGFAYLFLTATIVMIIS